MITTKGGITMGKAVKINITLPQEDLGRIDALVASQGGTRSGLILEALRSFMELAKEQETLRAKRMTIRKASEEIRKLRKRAGEWDGVSEIRKWRDLR
jgi:metal-responsive CopG/Arc/MetJ family transcriptional regulator